MMSSECYTRTHTTEKYTFSSWTNPMFCFNASLYSRDFADMFLIRMFDFLWSVFSENCELQLGCSFKKPSFPDLVEAIWSPRPKSHVILLFLAPALAELQELVSSSMMLDLCSVKWPCSSLVCEVWDYKDATSWKYLYGRISSDIGDQAQSSEFVLVCHPDFLQLLAIHFSLCLMITWTLSASIDVKPCQRGSQCSSAT